MKVQKAATQETVQTVPLKTVKPGSCFRFAHDSLEDAFKEDLFYLKVDAPEVQKERVRFVNLSDGKQLERDGDHRVIVHECSLHLHLG